MSQEIHYLETGSQDPFYNLAFEETVLRSRRSGEYLLLWQNDNTIVIGQNQNAEGEINRAFVEAHQIHVVRRTTGGGAVYHDLGNLNYSFITDVGDAERLTMERFTRPIVEALQGLGLQAEASGRNDILVDGKKISGNSQYIKGNRTMHHGCLLYETKLDEMSKVLNVSNTKIISKGIKSVQSRVANIRSYMKEPMTMEEFKSHLVSYMSKREKIEKYMFSEEDIKGIEHLKASVYDTWEWNYGASPEYNVIKSKRFEECGEIKVFMVVKYGIIQKIQIYGDFFGCMDVSQLTSLLEGCKLRIEDLRNVLGQCDIGRVIHNFSEEQFLELMME